MSKSGENRREIEISLPKNLINQIKGEQKNISEYIENLIKEDYKSNPPATAKSVKGQDGAVNPQALESLSLETAIKFLKNYRKEEWIDYILETRGESTIRKEAKRSAARKPEDWSEFSEELS